MMNLKGEGTIIWCFKAKHSKNNHLTLIIDHYINNSFASGIMARKLEWIPVGLKHRSHSTGQEYRSLLHQ